MSGLTIDDPITLMMAAVSGRVIAGDTLYLRGGTYAADYSFNLPGTALNPITIRPYNNERVIITGQIIFNGSYVHVYGLEFMGRDITNRLSAYPGSAPPDITKTGGVLIGADGGKLINCFVHDCVTDGISAFGDTTIELYGCLVFYNGWDGPDRGHGHGAYVQSDTKIKLVKDNIMFSNFGWGVHAYTEGSTINNIQVQGCTNFRSGLAGDTTHNNVLIGGYVVADNPVISNTMTYGAGGINLGFSAGTTDGTLTNNYASDGITKINCVNLTESGNTTGVVGNQVFLRSNDHDENRANLTIYNEAEANTVVVDVSGLGWTGQVRARNAQDYWSDIQTLTISGGNITVNMQAANRTVMTPVEWTAPSTTFPQFGAFILERIV